MVKTKKVHELTKIAIAILFSIYVFIAQHSSSIHGCAQSGIRSVIILSGDEADRLISLFIIQVEQYLCGNLYPTYEGRQGLPHPCSVSYTVTMGLRLHCN